MVSKTEILSALQFALINELNPINGTGMPRHTITYQYAGTSAPDDLPSGSSYSGWTAFTNAEKTAFEATLSHIETFLNVEFVEVTGAADPDLNAGKVTLAGSTTGYGGYYLTYYPTTNDIADFDSYVVFDNTLDLTKEPSLLLHEMGHALGLKHPFADPALPAALENNKYTVMSYSANPDNNLDSDAMMLFDTYALQDIWGTTAYNPGNTTYTGSRTDTVDAIWDSGGRNTFDAASHVTSVTLNLKQGAFSSFDAKDDVVITFGTRIHSAVGGSGDDTLLGNALRNNLKGNGGDDQINGRNGNDRLKGHAGNDTLIGGRGDDLLNGGVGNDTLNGNADNDTLNGLAGKDLLIGGLGHDDLLGKGGDDILKGNKGRDTLLGGGGNDTLKGGAHKDRLHGQAGDDTLFGQGGADTFIYRVSGGNDTIADFRDDIDTIRFSKLGDTAAILALAVETGTDVLFDFGGGDTLTVLNTTVNALSDDIFV